MLGGQWVGDRFSWAALYLVLVCEAKESLWQAYCDCQVLNWGVEEGAES